MYNRGLFHKWEIPVTAIVTLACTRVLESTWGIVLAQKRVTCPQCGARVDEEDEYCRRCSAKLKPEVPTFPAEEARTEAPTPPPYERQFSLIQRLYGVFLKPSETMRDIGLKPDFSGVAIILILQCALVIAAFSIAMPKIHITGTYAQEVMSAMNIVFAAVLILSPLIFLLRLVVKTAIVWKTCDSGSGWSFSNAAAVTGYAYAVDVALGAVGAAVGSFLLPEFHIDVSTLETISEAIQTYTSQTMTLLLAQMPITLVILFWKSYLGGVGTYFGTEKMCSKGMGIGVFLLLGFIGLVINLLSVLA